MNVWKQRQGWRPPAQTPDAPRRELYATLAVKGTHLPATWSQLVDLYAGLRVDGFWITVFRAGDSGVQLAALANLALALQERSRRPVMVSGIGSLHEALLTSGVAATCAGLHGMRPEFPPQQIDSDEVDGIAVQIYHPAILGVVLPGTRYAAALNRDLITHRSTASTLWRRKLTVRPRRTAGS